MGPFRCQGAEESSIGIDQFNTCIKHGFMGASSRRSQLGMSIVTILFYGMLTGHARGLLLLAARGGVVRDRHGDFICGFAAPFGFTDAMSAELQAVHDGMRICAWRKGLQVCVCIEVDATTVVNMIKGQTQPYWRYVYLARKVKSLLPFFDTINLIFREQNMVADKFAMSALEASEKKEFTSIHTVPRLIQKIIFLDRIGIPNFRSPCI